MKIQKFSNIARAVILSYWALNGASVALAIDLKPEDIRGKESEKSVSVLQQRYFIKAFRPELGILHGTFLNEAYTKTETRGLRASFFFNEWIGIEMQYVDTSVVSSDDRKALNKLEYRKKDPEEGKENEIVSPDPEINRILGYKDFNAILVPTYGKLNIIDSIIIYADIFFDIGMSQVNTDQGQKSAMTLGIGQRFYVLKRMSLRLDFRNHVFKEVRGGKDTNRNAYSVDFGASIFLF
jgi:outer membrane beta-barrel protein